MTTMSIGAFPTAPRAAASRATASRAATSRAATPRLRLTRRGRAVLMTLVAAPLVGVAMFVGLNAGGAVATDQPGVPLETVIVDSGESLWDIAAVVAPGSDPREFAAEVMQLNRLASPTLQPGQQLAIPAKYSD